MDCPECGGRLVDYRLGDRGAVGCEDCGYVGIDAEHRGRSTERESWDEALERFHRRHAVPDDAEAGARDDAEDVAPDETDESGATDRDAAENGGSPGRDVDRERPATVNGSVETDGADE